MKQYISKGDVLFCSVFAGLFTWGNALTLTTFGWFQVLFIIWNYLLNFVVLTAVLWLITRLLKRPIFGICKAYYFPLTTMIIISMLATAVFGVVTYIADDRPMTQLHLTIYIVGYIINTCLLLAYFYFSTKKSNK